MREMYQFIERCLKELKNPENELEVTSILEGLYSDVITDGMPPEVQAAIELRNIGEDDIVDNVLIPDFAIMELEEGTNQE